MNLKVMALGLILAVLVGCRSGADTIGVNSDRHELLNAKLDSLNLLLESRESILQIGDTATWKTPTGIVTAKLNKYCTLVVQEAPPTFNGINVTVSPQIQTLWDSQSQRPSLPTTKH